MPHTLLPTGTLVILVLSLASHVIASTGRGDTESDRPLRVRTTDRRLQAILHDGVRESPTFRALVDRLARSDVVVYVQCDRASAAHRLDGRLTFVSSAGGFRYVVVRVAWLNPRARQLAILAHELQHAVEIADTPAIVDGASLAREYRRMGYETRRLAAPLGIAFDTHAAIAAGERVLRDLQGE